MKNQVIKIKNFKNKFKINKKTFKNVNNLCILTNNKILSKMTL
jgi:hypothetical protein